VPKRDVQMIRDFAPERPEPVTAAPPGSSALTVIIDGAGVEITTGAKADVVVPFTATITAWAMLADQSGSIAVNVLRSVYAGFAPTVSMCTGAEPAIVTATMAESHDLSAWPSVSIVKGDVLRFYVDSCTDITRCSVALTLARTF